ncbi:hypothetical protein EHQ47_04940 [Leptospira bourretii]|uniref:polymorphic toxin-type HINT domain-containing protein n=1 Tax=Leptospira bourretii TaxID=2484962 RepID=UPI001090D691|nr:polymorphic toxin-type HINT domain-containing protein [Leptospira bourretii]TGL25282.1 hypothetical protein EHQ47_04940 [Leptospira bourretii]
MKEKYNEIKAEGEAFKNDAMAQGAGAVFGPSVAATVYKNKDIIKTGVALAATFASGGLAAGLVMGAMQAMEAYSSSGSITSALVAGAGGFVTGLMAGSGSALNVNLSYSESEGFGGSVGAYGQSVSYSQKDGFGASLNLNAKSTGELLKLAGSVVGSDYGGDLLVGAGNALTGVAEACGQICYDISVGVNYSKSGGFGVAAGYKNQYGLALGVGWSENDGFAGSAGIATKSGYAAGVSYNKSEGYGAYVTKNQFDANNARTGGYSLTFNERDGIGAQVSREFTNNPFNGNALGSAGSGTLSISQRGGVSLDYGNQAGQNYSLGYGIDGGFNISAGNSYFQSTYDSGNGFSMSQNTSSYTDGIALSQASNMSAMENISENVYGKAQEVDRTKKQWLESKNVKYTDEQWARLDEETKEKLIQQVQNDRNTHLTRTDMSDRFFGNITDFADQLGGKFGDHSGWMEKDAKGNAVFTARTCFVAGTKVHTKEGLKNIEDIRVGDLVLSKSDETGEVSYRKVVETFIRQTDAIYTVSFADGTTLETTWNHPFRVKKQGYALEKFSIENTTWVQAKDLHPGDVALGANGKELAITDITIDEREETVYNFEVEGYHTYFVGEVGVWVHNECNFVSPVASRSCGPEMCADSVKPSLSLISASVDATVGSGYMGEVGIYREITYNGKNSFGYFINRGPTAGLS